GLNSPLIYIVILIGFAGYCVYDGYFNEKFIEKHTKDGKPDSTLVFNQKAPPFLALGALWFGFCAFQSRSKKVVADENAISSGKKTITYDSIEKIDKTYFKSKGYFIITCKNEGEKQQQLKLSDRDYDNLQAILDHVISKIS
ncbi:unnamed protein product, partial [marine sediment metagenome]